jgi:hypothetical protein
MYGDCCAYVHGQPDHKRKLDCCVGHQLQRKTPDYYNLLVYPVSETVVGQTDKLNGYGAVNKICLKTGRRNRCKIIPYQFWFFELLPTMLCL